MHFPFSFLQVESTVVHFVPREDVVMRDFDLIEAGGRVLFSTRRKQLKTILKYDLVEIMRMSVVSCVM